ncbi:MAG: hypothetical protein Q9M32_00165 [Sulfurimonas sp.]|nr:hypothetical protein [Sulfurimonas sp.]
MKVLAWLVGVLAVIVGGVYFIAFTPSGNSILKPIIEEKINEATELDTKLNTFALNTSEFEIFLELDAENTIHAKGTYALLSQAFDAAYNVKLEKLQNLTKLTKTELLGAFRTNGTAVGDIAYMEIDGVSDVGLSDTTYHVELTDLNPTSIIAKIKNADLESLLELGGQKAYAKAKLDVDINFKNIKVHELDGDISLATRDGILNTKLLNKDLELNIPKTNFAMNLDAVLKGDDINYTYVLNSNLAKVTSDGKVVPAPLNVDIKYALNIAELAVLKPITNADVRGAFKLNGTVKGSKEKMTVNGFSDLASSDTTFTAILKDFKASSLEAQMKNLHLAKVLHMAKQPHYADGIFDLDIAMSNLEAGQLKGTVKSNIKNGLLDVKFISKMQKFKTRMPKTTFALSTVTELDADIVDTKAQLNSSLANLDIKQARVNLKDGSIVSDYTTTIPNLDKLYFVIERHLKGSFKATGDFKKKDDNTEVTMHSNVAGGVMDVKMHNDDLSADLKSIQTIDAMKMLLYPPVFKAALNGKLAYNVAQKKGKFQGSLVDGGFEKNMAFTMMKQYAQIDLYKENFKGDVSADINKELVLASFDLKSNRSSIKTVNTKINSDTNIIYSKIEIVADKNPLTVVLSGNKSAPKIMIDAKSLMQGQATKEISKQLEGKIGKEASDQIGNLLKGFF